jgi:glycopeptide antibiotics resistance protein
MALGVGTVNELVEFLAVVFLNAEEAVGGYFNNSLDIVFNTIGSLLATVLIYIYRERPQFLQNLHDKAISKS